MATTVTNGKTGTKSRPIFSKKYWPVQVAVFEFRNDGRLNHSIEMTRSFRRGEESTWETSPYLTTADLLPAARLLGEAYSVIQARIQQDLADRRTETAEETVAEAVPF